LNPATDLQTGRSGRRSRGISLRDPKLDPNQCLINPKSLLIGQFEKTAPGAFAMGYTEKNYQCQEKRRKFPFLLVLIVFGVCSSIKAQTPPSQAAAAGYKTLVFDDEFNSPDTVSPNGSGNYNWYLTNIYGLPALPASGYSIQDGYLEIKTDASGFSYGMATVDAENTVQAWQHGYFEASILFCSTCSQGHGWPSFWSSSIELATHQISESAPAGELDFFEYYVSGGYRAYLTTVHQASGTTKGVQNPNNVPTVPSGTNYGTWHIYGCLWTPNEVRWYFDNNLVETVKTGPGTPYTALEQEKMFLILGSGVNWPMYVDYVHVWQ
jgi:beta-glucanase (GH16 family)